MELGECLELVGVDFNSLFRQIETEEFSRLNPEGAFLRVESHLHCLAWAKILLRWATWSVSVRNFAIIVGVSPRGQYFWYLYRIIY